MLGIMIGIAAVIGVVALGTAAQKRVEQHLNNLGDNFVWIEAGGRAVNGVDTGEHALPTLTVADSVAIKNQEFTPITPVSLPPERARADQRLLVRAR